MAPLRFADLAAIREFDFWVRSRQLIYRVIECFVAHHLRTEWTDKRGENGSIDIVRNLKGEVPYKRSDHRAAFCLSAEPRSVITCAITCATTAFASF
jgi:hypothetical protein